MFMVQALATVIAVFSLSSLAHADDMSAWWGGMTVPAAQAAAAQDAAMRSLRDQAFRAAWGGGAYPKCDSNATQNNCPADYICWGTNECLPRYCHMGCAYNSPCWPDGTCNYGE